MNISSRAGSDFTVGCWNVMIPAAVQPGLQTFELPEFYSIVDDEINEAEESFALVATVGDDVSATCDVNGIISECSCFQTGVECFGQSGATQIRISDNDRKYNIHYHLLSMLVLFF